MEAFEWTFFVGHIRLRSILVRLRALLLYFDTIIDSSLHLGVTLLSVYSMMHELVSGAVGPETVQIDSHVGVLSAWNIGEVNILLNYGHAFHTLATSHMITHFILLSLGLLILARRSFSSYSSWYGLGIRFGQIVIVAWVSCDFYKAVFILSRLSGSRLQLFNLCIVSQFRRGTGAAENLQFIHKWTALIQFLEARINFCIFIFCMMGTHIIIWIIRHQDLFTVRLNFV